MVVERRQSRTVATQVRRRSTTIHHLLFTLYRLLNVRVDGLGVARAVDAAEAVRALVVVQEWPRLKLVGREPLLYRLGVVVRAARELRVGVEVADLVRLRRLEVDVVNLAADGAATPTR